MFQVGKDGNYTEVNKEFESMIGSSRDKLLRMQYRDLMKSIFCPLPNINKASDILNSVFTGQFKFL
jgi:hypothetical protein